MCTAVLVQHSRSRGEFQHLQMTRSHLQKGSMWDCFGASWWGFGINPSCCWLGVEIESTPRGDWWLRGQGSLVHEDLTRSLASWPCKWRKGWVLSFRQCSWDGHTNHTLPHKSHLYQSAPLLPGAPAEWARFFQPPVPILITAAALLGIFCFCKHSALNKVSCCSLADGSWVMRKDEPFLYNSSPLELGRLWKCTCSAVTLRLPPIL